MSQYQFRLCTPDDAAAVQNFLWSLKDDLFFTERETVEEITQTLFQEGGILVGTQYDEMVALLGYVYGNPAKDYQNKDVGFLYVVGLAESVRRTRIMLEGLHFVVRTFLARGTKTFRFHALETDKNINRMYSLLARPIGKERNRRGYPCNLYEATIEELAVALSRMNQDTQAQIGSAPS
ncbi:MAG: hypothetical protein AAF702_39855 [Chloroflexota bacterium]